MSSGQRVAGEGQRTSPCLGEGRLFLNIWLVTTLVDRGWRIPCKCQGEATKD